MVILYAISGVLVAVLVSIIRKANWREDLCVGAAVIGFQFLLVPLAPIEAYLRPLTWDSRLHSWDAAIRIDVIALARWCLSHPWTVAPIIVIYSSLPFMVTLNWSLEGSRRFLRAAVIGAVLAVPFYMLVPACGPQYAFAGYPWHTVLPTGLIAVASHPRNCFPSMHMTWALLLPLNARGRLWKRVLWVYAALVGLATAASGEHYFIDLIAAMPFTLLVQHLAVATERIHWTPLRPIGLRGEVE